MVAAVTKPETDAPTDQEQLLKKGAQPDTTDTSPGTPPAEKPTLSPPPPDTPLEGSTPTSTSSEDAHAVSASSASASQLTSSAKAGKDASFNPQAPAFVPNAAAAPFIPGSLPAVSSQRQPHAAAGQMLNGSSPTASNTTSTHAAWEEAGYGNASAYGNGYSGYENYGGYANGYSYSYNAGYCMTYDGLFVPQLVWLSTLPDLHLCICLAMLQWPEIASTECVASAMLLKCTLLHALNDQILSHNTAACQAHPAQILFTLAWCWGGSK